MTMMSPHAWYVDLPCRRQPIKGSRDHYWATIITDAIKLNANGYLPVPDYAQQSPDMLKALSEKAACSLPSKSPLSGRTLQTLIFTRATEDASHKEVDNRARRWDRWLIDHLCGPVWCIIWKTGWPFWKQGRTDENRRSGDSDDNLVFRMITF